MQRATGGRLHVKSSDVSTWEGGGTTTSVKYPGRRKGTPRIPDVLSGNGGAADMPHGGVPGESGNKDGNAGALRAPACPQNRGDAGGRKIPPPTVRQVRHAGPPEGAEQAAHGDCAVPQGSGEEDMATDIEGDEGELGAVVRIFTGRQ